MPDKDTKKDIVNWRKSSRLKSKEKGKPTS